MTAFVADLGTFFYRLKSTTPVSRAFTQPEAMFFCTGYSRNIHL
jgi:hypothetical protein